MHLLRWIGVIALILLAAMQFARPDRVNRQVETSQTIEAVTHTPPHISMLLEKGCGDCHSENTSWRWYSNVAPVSWLQMADVGMARDLMNFSRWSGYPPDEQADMLDHICEMARSGEMPPWYYKPLHPQRRLSKIDTGQICQWTQKAQQAVSAAR